MERTVFADSEFLQESRRFVLLRVDVTNGPDGSSEDIIKLFATYDPTTGGQMPLPTVLFVDSQGKEMRGLRAVGAERIADFVAKMKQVS